MKVIFNIFRGIIIAYLITLTFIFVVLYVKKNAYHEKYPDLNGYSYFSVDSSVLEPDIKKNNFIILKESQSIDVGDFVAYFSGENEEVIVRKVVDRNEYKLTVDVTNNYENKNYREEIIIDDVCAKMIYNNDTFSSIMNVLLNPVTIVILLFLGTIFPEFIFDK